jgi:hypothetical protein
MISKKKKWALLYAALTLCGVSLTAHSFTLEITGKEAISGEQASSPSCERFGEAAFTGAAGNTLFTDTNHFSHGTGLQLTIEEGMQGFGSLGGIIDFSTCKDMGSRILRKGDEIWIRARFNFPVGFEFNQIGRNKFMRLRTFRDIDGRKVHEGYNDLYIDGQDEEHLRSPARFHFIFEGEQRWASIGTTEDFFDFGNWTTIEYYLKFDDVPASEGGQARVMVWLDGHLIGETDERKTLRYSESYVEALYFFTWWGNDGSHKTQSFYVDDLVITSETPAERDAFGNPYIGALSTPSHRRPKPPQPLH